MDFPDRLLAGPEADRRGTAIRTSSPGLRLDGPEPPDHRVDCLDPVQVGVDTRDEFRALPQEVADTSLEGFGEEL
jgi:hypothetical protein